MENEYTIAILITCHNRRDKTISCLDALFAAIIPKEYRIEVFLVDDGSYDGTGYAVKKQFPQVKVIQGDGNLYWTRGMNVAWQTAAETFTYDFYLWLNDDVILMEDGIYQILMDSKLFNYKSIICGVCEDDNNTISYSGYLLNEKIRLKPQGTPIICDFFNGNVVLIPKCIFNEIGYLYSVFHHGQGDFDYGLRAKNKGIKSYISSKIIAKCNRNNELPIWCNPSIPLKRRIKTFYSPLGGHPKTSFIYQKRHIGLFVATFHYFTIHLRLLLPILWLKRKDSN